jgi:hypothetical protein
MPGCRAVEYTQRLYTCTVLSRAFELPVDQPYASCRPGFFGNDVPLSLDAMIREWDTWQKTLTA